MTPRVSIEAIGARQSVMLAALFDTGFDGDLCLPIPIAVTLGLELKGQGRVEYADGRRESVLVFTGSVGLLGETREVEITLTESEEALVGTGLLAGCTAFMDFDTGELHIERKEMDSTPQQII